MITSTGRLFGWPVALGLLVAVYLSGLGAVLFAPAGDPVATWWPAAGIGVALMALAPRHWWPWLAVGVVVASGAANLTAGRGPETSALYGLSNAAEAVVAGLFLRQGREQTPGLETQEDFLRLVGAAILGALTIACGAAGTVVLLGEGPFLEAFRATFASHAASTLVIVPVALTLGRGTPTRRTWERWIQGAALAVVTVAVFAPLESLPLTFVPLPFLVWAALRLNVLTVSWQLAAFSALTTFLTASGRGPFGGGYTEGRLTAAEAGSLTQLYLLCAALMALPLAIAVHQRRLLLDRVMGSERLFRRNFTESLVGMVLLRSDGVHLDIFDLNDTAARMFGSQREPLVGRPLDAVLETSERFDEIAARILGGELEGWSAQTGLAGRPGARINVALSLLSGAPDPVFSAQLQDVTAEHDARREREAAESLTSATLNTTACIILVTDLDGTIVRVNAATRELTGYSDDELLGRPVWDTSIAPPAIDVEGLAVHPGRAGGPVLREGDALTKSGEKRRIVWNQNIVADDEGRPQYAVMTGIDVTAERTASDMMIHLLEAPITTSLIGIDPDGRITVFNAGAQRLLGYHYLEIIGEPFVRILEPGQLRDRTGEAAADAAFSALIAMIGPGGESPMRDWTWVASDGRPHTTSMTLSITLDSTGAPAGFLCIGRDVTEQRHGQEMLVAALEKERTAVEQLRQVDEAKNEFVSTVSHELRTPVTSIVGYTEMLADGSVVDPDPLQLPMLETIARNGERLLVICNDLLLLSGLDSGATLWEREAIDLVTVLDNVEPAIRPLLSGRDLSLCLERLQEPVTVLGDRAHLERVLINLLSNAVKFTEDGGKISCRVETHGSDAWLIVSDTGIGIPEDEQSGLFQRFFRSSTAQERAIQGTGLGLSIAAAIVAAHGGRIGVESAHLQGTTFTVQLPLNRSGARG